MTELVQIDRLSCPYPVHPQIQNLAVSPIAQSFTKGPLMSLKPLECPNCHGRIDSFDETTKKGFCPFCDYVIVDVPERQNQFAVDAQGHVQVAGIAGTEEQYRRVKDFMHLGEKDRALTLAQEFADKHPMDFRGWQLLCELQIDEALSATSFSPLSDKSTPCHLVKTSIDHMITLAQTSTDTEYPLKTKRGIERVREEALITIETDSNQAEALATALEKQEKILQSRTNELSTDRMKLIRADYRKKSSMDYALSVVSGTIVFFVAVYINMNQPTRAVPFAIGAALIGGIIVFAVMQSIKDKNSAELEKRIQQATDKLVEAEKTLEKKRSNMESNSNELIANKNLYQYTESLIELFDKSN